MKSILESAIAALLDDNTDRATELMRNYMIQRSRKIHESLRQGDESILKEDFDDSITSEEYYDVNDLADAENAAEDNADEEEVEAAADDLETDMGMDSDELEADTEETEEDGEQIEDRLEDFEDQLDTLVAQFEELMGDVSTEADDVDNLETDADADVEELEDTADDLEMDTEEEDELEEGDLEIDIHHEDEDDDFDSITESIASDLEKISLSLDDDGKEVGTGKSFDQNKATPIPMKPMAERGKGGKPVEIKSNGHKGFDRETAPDVKDTNAKFANSRKRSTDNTQRVSKEGDKSAELNKLKSDGNNVSPLGKKK